MMGSATNKEELRRFIPLLASHVREPDSERKPIVIMDGHPAHRSPDIWPFWEEHFAPKLMPPYSSPFNPVETVWAHIKREFYK